MEEWNEAHINMKEGILRETGRTHRQYVRAQKKHEYKRSQKADQYKAFHGNLDDLDESGDDLACGLCPDADQSNELISKLMDPTSNSRHIGTRFVNGIVESAGEQVRALVCASMEAEKKGKPGLQGEEQGTHA